MTKKGREERGSPLSPLIPLFVGSRGRRREGASRPRPSSPTRRSHLTVWKLPAEARRAFVHEEAAAWNPEPSRPGRATPTPEPLPSPRSPGAGK